MPIYTYKCECGRECEKLFLSINDKKIDCKDCGRTMKKVPALGSFRLKGKWFATTGEY